MIKVRQDPQQQQQQQQVFLKIAYGIHARDQKLLEQLACARLFQGFPALHVHQMKSKEIDILPLKTIKGHIRLQ